MKRAQGCRIETVVLFGHQGEGQFNPEAAAVETLHRVWRLRADGLPVYATMDAGPNVKLLFVRDDEAAVRAAFPTMQLTGGGAARDSHGQTPIKDPDR